MKFEARSVRKSAAATKYLTFNRIQSDRYRTLIVGLMIAANDIQMANWSAVRYAEENENELPRMQRHLRIGALQYFVRLMTSHLHETLPLIEEFGQHTFLLEILEKKCSEIAREGYAAMRDCLPGGSDADVFGAQISKLRNKLSFHYDRDFLSKAIKRLANDPKHPPAEITMGTDYFLSRFNMADRVCDSVLVQQVSTLHGTTDREKLSSFMDFVNQKCLAFLCFSREFAGIYFSL